MKSHLKYNFIAFICMYVLMSYRKPKFEAVLSPRRYSEGHRRRKRDVNIFAKFGSGSCRVLSECGGNGRAAKSRFPANGPGPQPRQRPTRSTRRKWADGASQAPLCLPGHTSRVCPAPLALLGATEAAAEISRARARAACPAPIGLRPPRALRPPRDETQSGMAVVCDGRDAPYLSVRPRKYPPRKKIAFNSNRTDNNSGTEEEKIIKRENNVQQQLVNTTGLRESSARALSSNC